MPWKANALQPQGTRRRERFWNGASGQSRSSVRKQPSMPKSHPPFTAAKPVVGHARGGAELHRQPGHGTPHTLHPSRKTLHPTSHTPHPNLPVAKPYDLHPTPYILRSLSQNPTPYTLHPTLHTPHPSPHTLHPTPYTLHPTPHTLHSPSSLPPSLAIPLTTPNSARSTAELHQQPCHDNFLSLSLS